MQLRFDYISPNDSTIEYKMTVDGNGLGTLTFCGNYKRGSEGNVDGFFMEEVTGCALKHVLVKSLIVDLRGLEYSWGNTIINTISLLSTADVPVAVIYSDKCEGIVDADEGFFVKTELEALEVISKR